MSAPIAKLIERLRAATMGFDWADLPDDACVPAVPLLREAADALASSQEEIARQRKALAFADEQSAEVEALLEPHITWEPGTVRICPMRDGPCPHGLKCPYIGDGYMGWPCKDGWSSDRAAARALASKAGAA